MSHTLKAPGSGAWATVSCCLLIGLVVAVLLVPQARAQMTADPALEETNAQDEGLETFLLQRVMSFDFRGVKLDSEAPGILLYEGLQDPEQLAHGHLEN